MLITENYNPLYLPQDNDYSLRIFKNTVELTLYWSRPTNTSPIKWDVVPNSTGSITSAGSASKFTVTINNTTASITNVGFKRMPYYATLGTRDLRMCSQFYLQLATTASEGQTVKVTNPDQSLWTSSMVFSSSVNSFNFNPAIHVNQVGYESGFSKKAHIGYYFGSLNEFDATQFSSSKFNLIDTNNNVVFTGSLVVRPDSGYNYTPTPYQKVMEADFSNFNTQGKYRLQISGLGCSYPFYIGTGIFLNFARVMAHGVAHRRCGYALGYPYTRYPHVACHTQSTAIPTPDVNYSQVWSMIGSENHNGEGQVVGVPVITSSATCLYPYTQTGSIDTHGGHHDAGDYSNMYGADSAYLTHFLVFAADNLGAGVLDNLQIPESGDGKSDLLAEAKWEADFILRMQDPSGGFYHLNNPLTRRFENDNTVTLRNSGSAAGDPRAVWPITLAATANNIGALAEIGSSPLFRQQYGTAVADTYLSASLNGWNFMNNYITAHGLSGSFQFLYSAPFYAQDGISYAAAAMFAAFGNSTYLTRLKTWYPNPASTSTYQFGWRRATYSYGCALRAYAFAVRSGRRQSADMDAAYLTLCETELTNVGADVRTDTSSSAYGMCLELESKGFAGGTGGNWFFNTEKAIHLAVAHQISPNQNNIDYAILNTNFIAGDNPINVPTITGLGSKRRRQIVDQYAQTDFHKLPIMGIQLGTITQDINYNELYKNPDNSNEMTSLCYPDLFVFANHMPPYERHGIDFFNVNAEIDTYQMAITLAFFAWLAAMTPAKNQPWKSG